MPEAEAPDLLPLRLRGLRFAIGGRRLVDGIDLDLGREGVTMIMGPNGAGKSLLLRLIHGLIAPGAGEISWGGHALGPAIRRHQAMVFQTPVLLRRSVAGNLDFVLPRRDRARRRAALLDQAGLSEQAHQPARRLSGGEQQRLALARALATEPQVLLLDEPTASLDPGSVLRFEQIVRATAEAGIRTIFVTHDVGQARRLADDVVFLAAGRVAEHAAAAQFFARPRSAAAGAYLAGRLVV